MTGGWVFGVVAAAAVLSAVLTTRPTGYQWWGGGRCLAMHMCQPTAVFSAHTAAAAAAVQLVTHVATAKLFACVKKAHW